MHDFEVAEARGKLAGIQTETRELFAGTGNVHDRRDQTAGYDAAFGGLEKIALEVVAHGDEIPGIGFDCELMLLEIRHARVDRRIVRLENADGFARSIDSGDAPTTAGQPQSVAPSPASQVEGAAGRQILRDFDQQRRRRAGLRALAIVFVPSSEVHMESVAFFRVRACDLISDGMKLLVPAFVMMTCLRAQGTGETLFREHCAPCHGIKGDGGRGANLAVRKLPRAPDDATLGAIIAQGIPGTEMPVTRMTDAERAALVKYVRSLGQTQAAHVNGNAARGEELFWSKGRCGQCHTVGARGGRIGPDLTNIGERRGPANLRQSILDPEAETPENFGQYRKVIYMPDNYLRVRVVTGEGKEITGVRVDEDTFTIQIRDDASRFYSFRKDQLKELHKDWGKSPMPGYRTVFTENELNDVIAYLASLTGAP